MVFDSAHVTVAPCDPLPPQILPNAPLSFLLVTTRQHQYLATGLLKTVFVCLTDSQGNGDIGIFKYPVSTALPKTPASVAHTHYDLSLVYCLSCSVLFVLIDRGN